MAEKSNDGPTGAQQNLGVLAQYVKDLSFENPGAPQSLRSRNTSPTINIAINVRSNPMPNSPTDVEVELAIDVRALDGDAVLFAAELVYAGLFRMTNIPPENMMPLALIECPRLLFPFARQIIADASRNGGFPPLLVDPVDFFALYQQRAAGQTPQPRRLV
jgi:preprotein translocase subunit SecB